MSKFPIKSFFLLSKRTLTVAAENARVVQSATSVMRKTEESGGGKAEVTEEGGGGKFWMRDPKTGNWIPESHFDEIDVADMRHKILSKKQKD